MKALVIVLSILSGAIAQAKGTPFLMECQRADTAAKTILSGIDDTNPTGPFTTITLVEKQETPDSDIKTYAVNESIVSEGSIHDINFSFRASSRLTSPKNSCYKRGTQAYYKTLFIVGGKGHGKVHMMEVRELPVFVAKNPKGKPCAIPKPMPPKPYNISCKHLGMGKQ